MATHFLAFVKEELQAQADAQQGPPSGYCVSDGRDQSGASQIVYRVAKGSYAGQDQPVGTRYVFSARRHPGRYADVREGLLNVTEVAHAIVDDHDVHG